MKKSLLMKQTKRQLVDQVLYLFETMTTNTSTGASVVTERNARIAELEVVKSAVECDRDLWKHRCQEERDRHRAEIQQRRNEAEHLRAAIASLIDQLAPSSKPSPWTGEAWTAERASLYAGRRMTDMIKVELRDAADAVRAVNTKSPSP